ncbi:ROK family protein [Gordonia desulfuricans]|uniref:ROK family protein n=1 Tax=Gordonia desulfuricans TaxID=89051 RepID=A0A7K3LLX2_9ACTN|nr:MULTISPECIES: ROK family protein [Gordonia]KOY49149.1 ROK family transcriptional regulator [Gordonia sp. NB41Y]NDK89250.1 ROK family protein [Gordonia desulfuricans]WLP89350.1 ROK family protein [Gordonia sp. NB41Y]
MQAVVPATLQVTSTPAALVLQAIRVGAPITRDTIAADTGLSPATINRQIVALADLGFVTERRDLVHHGGIGRPKNPLTLDRDGLCVAGMHIGARRTLLALADLGGRTLYSHAVRTPDGPPDAAVDELCAQLRTLADRFSGRRLLWGGVAIGGRVDTATGVVDHPVLGWRKVGLGERLAQTLGVPVSVCEHVQAMAAAELLLGSPRSTDESGLFFYARETTGMAVTVNGRVVVPARGAGTIAHVRVDAPVLGPGPETLQGVIGVAAATRAAERLGVSPDASCIADERAAILGEVVAGFRDAFNPDTVIVAGDAFAAHPQGLAPVQAAFDAASCAGWPLELTPSRFGHGVQESAAIVVALSVIYADPIGAMA